MRPTFVLYVRQHLKDVVDNELPLTKRRVVSRQPVDLAGTGLPILLLLSSTAPSLLCPALQTILAASTSSSLLPGPVCIPGRVRHRQIPIYPEETNNVPFNAYILDFFKHGDLQALVRDNGIRRGDVWFHLKDFSLILVTIVTSFECLLDSKAESCDASMIDTSGCRRHV